MDPRDHAEILIASADLTDGQTAAARAIAEGRHAFVTGSAGCGKTFVINVATDIIAARSPSAVITRVAPTGVAAVGMGQGATTLHRHFGIPRAWTPKRPMPEPSASVSEGALATTVLIVDEISMISVAIFELMSAIYSMARKDSRPFGGVQVVVSGDFMQLPPVATEDDPAVMGLPAHTGKVWAALFGNTASVHVLTESKRHEDDDMRNFLADVRQGLCSARVIAELTSMAARQPDPAAIHLVGTRAMAETLNSRMLNELAIAGSDYFVCRAMDFASPAATDEDKAEASAMAPTALNLVVGATYMFKVNLHIHGRPPVCNGTIGTLREFTQAGATLHTPAIRPGEAVINLRFDVPNGSVVVGLHDFAVKTTAGALKAVRQQYPVIPAYALTVHSTQGVTLRAGVLDLSRTFAQGQAYVALSRFMNLKGISISTTWQVAARAILNQHVTSGFDFYKSLNTQ